MANNQVQNNYFTSNIRRYNREDFVCMMKPEQIQRDAKNRIFRELVQGKIDYSIYGKYFLEPKFIDNLIISADNELRNNTTILNQTILNRLNLVRMYSNVGYLTDLSAVLVNQRTFI